MKLKDVTGNLNLNMWGLLYVNHTSVIVFLKKVTVTTVNVSFQTNIKNREMRERMRINKGWVTQIYREEKKKQKKK